MSMKKVYPNFNLFKHKVLQCYLFCKREILMEKTLSTVFISRLLILRTRIVSKYGDSGTMITVYSKLSLAPSRHLGPCPLMIA